MSTSTTPPADLWAVHVQGPDDLHPAASREQAIYLATWINLGLLRVMTRNGAATSALAWAVPAPWPGTSEDHASGLTRENRDPRWTAIDPAFLAAAAAQVFGSPTPRVLRGVPPYGYTQYTDADGDYLTAGAYPRAEREETGSCCAIATNGHDGCRLTREQASDLASWLLDVAKPPLQPTSAGAPDREHCIACRERIPDGSGGLDGAAGSWCGDCLAVAEVPA